MPGHSKALWLLDQNLVNPFASDLPASGFGNLEDRIFFFDTKGNPPLFPELPLGWEQFGPLVNKKPLKPSPGSTGLALSIGVKWLLAIRWKLPLSLETEPYTLLLEAQDRLRPEKLSLLPGLIVPLLFITRMAPFKPTSTNRDNSSVRFLPSFYTGVQKLHPVISDLFHWWATGPSQAAARYRAGTTTPANTRRATPSKSKAKTQRSQSSAGEAFTGGARIKNSEPLTAVVEIVGQEWLE